MNRTYSVVFGLLSILLSILLFFLIKNVQSNTFKGILFFLNGLVLIISILTSLVFYTNIDPDVQFRDSKILFVNKENHNEKIIEQYDVNWKTNEKLFQNNQVENFGIFRLYKHYRIDTLKIDKEKWKKAY